LPKGLYKTVFRNLPEKPDKGIPVDFAPLSDIFPSNHPGRENSNFPTGVSIFSGITGRAITIFPGNCVKNR
jgi:hypothetical protein